MIYPLTALTSPPHSGAHHQHPFTAILNGPFCFFSLFLLPSHVLFFPFFLLFYLKQKAQMVLDGLPTGCQNAVPLCVPPLPTATLLLNALLIPSVTLLFRKWYPCLRALSCSHHK